MKSPEFTTRVLARKTRGGFTLVELLVTISIFVILLAITASAFNVNQDREKLSGAARQLQSAVEGARSRAFKLQRPVGLRFNVDENDPTVCPSMTYIQQLEPIRGKVDIMDTTTVNGQLVSQIQLRRIQGPPDTDNDLNGDGIISAADNLAHCDDANENGIDDDGDTQDKPLTVRYTDGTGFINGRGLGDGIYDTYADYETIINASRQGLLIPGVEIRITSGGTDFGEYRLIASAGTTHFNPTQGIFYIFPAFHEPNNALQVIRNTNPLNRVRQSLDFEITPAPIPLQGEEPLVFPEGVVIDWDSSLPPREWGQITSSQPWQPSYRYSIGQWARVNNFFLKCVDVGVSATTMPNPTIANDIISDGTVHWRTYEAPQLDLLFSPRGSAVGSVATNGLIHFGLAYRRDTDLQQLVGGVVQHSIYDVRTKPDGTYEFKGDHRISTLFLQSGVIITNEPDFTDTSPADNIADHPFSYALSGAEAK